MKFLFLVIMLSASYSWGVGEPCRGEHCNAPILCSDEYYNEPIFQKTDEGKMIVIKLEEVCAELAKLDDEIENAPKSKRKLPSGRTMPVRDNDLLIKRNRYGVEHVAPISAKYYKYKDEHTDD